MQQQKLISEECFQELFPTLPCLIIRRGCVWHDIFTDEACVLDIFDPDCPNAKSARRRQIDHLKMMGMGVLPSELEALTFPNANLVAPIFTFPATRQEVIDLLEWAFSVDELAAMEKDCPEIAPYIKRRTPQEVFEDECVRRSKREFSPEERKEITALIVAEVGRESVTYFSIGNLFRLVEYEAKSTTVDRGKLALGAKQGKKKVQPRTN